MSHSYTSTSNSYSFTYVSMLGVDLFYLSSGSFATMSTVGPSGASDTLMCAPVTSAFGSILVVDDVPRLTTQQLNFQIRDRWYDVVANLPNVSFLLTID